MYYNNKIYKYERSLENSNTRLETLQENPLYLNSPTLIVIDGLLKEKMHNINANVNSTHIF